MPEVIVNTSPVQYLFQLGLLDLLPEQYGSVLVILDDGLARRFAQRLNLRLTGTLGVLLRAHQQRRISALEPVLDQLERLNFRLDPATRASVLKIAAES